MSKKTALRVYALTGIKAHDLFDMDYEEFVKAMSDAMRANAEEGLNES